MTEKRSECVTLEELVKNKVRSWEEAFGLLLALKRGEIELETPSGRRWFFSTAGLWYWASIMLVVTSLFVVIMLDGILMYIFGAILFMFMPGYFLTEALYPRGDEKPPLERFTLSVGLSLAITPATALLLSFTPWGITPITLTVTLSGLAISIATFAAWRKSKNPLTCSTINKEI